MTPLVVLGARRAIGQSLISRLVDHPWFEVVAFGDHGSTAKDDRFENVCDWRSCDPMSDRFRALPHRTGDAEALAGLTGPGCLVLSVLQDGRSAETDRACRAAGARVVTHAEDLRLHPNVPLVIPELMTAPLSTDLVATPNCTTVLLALALHAVRSLAEIEAVTVTCLQAVSGADLPGPSALDMLDNLFPHLRGEEAALEREMSRLFGDAFPVSAHAVRVPVRVGHTLLVSLKLSQRVDEQDLRDAWHNYEVPIALRTLPSIVERPIRVADAADRPCPEPDAHAADGMAISVGALRSCPVLDWRFVVTGNNMVRGSAGMSLLTGEWMTACGSD
ncbi:MAG: hypothetical protein MJE12_28755 [Alphaproteobacteria bacterium]|nr:hypothetical protein [Alphaproteobacteria bacterium]